MATVVFNFVLSPVMKYTVVPSYNLNTPPKMTFIVITFLLLRAAIAYVYKSIERKAAEKDDTNKNILKRDARLPPQIEKIFEDVNIPLPTPKPDEYLSLRQYDTSYAQSQFKKTFTSMILPFLFFYLGRQISGICVQIVTTVVKFLMDDIVQEYFMGIKKPRPFAEDFFTRLLKKILDKVSTVVNKETTVASPGDKGKNEEKPVTAEEAPPMKEPQRSRTETHED